MKSSRYHLDQSSSIFETFLLHFLCFLFNRTNLFLTLFKTLIVSRLLFVLHLCFNKLQKPLELALASFMMRGFKKVIVWMEMHVYEFSCSYFRIRFWYLLYYCTMISNFSWYIRGQDTIVYNKPHLWDSNVWGLSGFSLYSVYCVWLILKECS